MTTPPGHVDWLGQALVHGINEIVSQSVNTVPGNSTLATTVTFSKPGYLIVVSATIPVAATNPFINVNLRWEDNVPVSFESQDWQFPATSSGNSYIVSGVGPVSGQQLLLSFTNLDVAQTATVTYSLMETTHHIARHDWRNANNSRVPPGTIPGQTLALGANMSAGILTEFVGTPAALTNYLMPLYSGQVWLSYQIVVPAANVGELFISPYNNAGVRYFDTGSIAPSTVIQNAVAVTLPRKPCFLQVDHSGSTTTQYAVSVTAMEYAS